MHAGAGVLGSVLERRTGHREGSVKLTPRQLHEACAAWASGGCLGLGLWLSRFKKPHSVSDYAELVGLVRAELQDETDYGKE